jgi:hypothetical protein
MGCLTAGESVSTPTNQPELGQTSLAMSGDEGKTSTNTVSVTPPISPLYGSFTTKVYNMYITRGIVVQGEGASIQPVLDLNYHLHNFGGFFNDLSLTTEFWNDISSNQKVSAPPTSAPYWTETFLRAGFSLGFARYFTLASDFTQFLTPANGYPEGRYLKNILSMNDTGLLLPDFSLKPQLTVLYELPDIGQPGLAPHAWWFEPGVTPNYTFFSARSYPVNLGLPIRIGLGREFYAGTAYGFCSVGPQLTVPLTALSTAWGKWSITAGYTYYNLGTTTAAIAPEHHHSQNQFNAALSLVF